METPRIDVVRALAAPMEFRAAGAQDDGIGLLTGHFSVFNTWYEVNSMWEGNFLERVAPGAFAQTIVEDRSGMKILFDHGYDPQIGNKVLGPIRTLEEDSTGPYYESPLFDTSYNRDLLPGLKEGVYGASFRFRVMEESWNDEPGVSDHNPKGIPERTITRTKTMEFGPVTFPASQAATAGVRSLTDEFYSHLKQRDAGRYADALRSAGITDLTDMPRHVSGATEALTEAQRRLDEAKAAQAEAERQLAALTDPTEQPDARSAGGGEGTPGNEGEPATPATPQAPDPEAAARDRDLRLKGILR